MRNFAEQLWGISVSGINIAWRPTGPLHRVARTIISLTGSKAAGWRARSTECSSMPLASVDLPAHWARLDGPAAGASRLGPGADLDLAVPPIGEYRHIRPRTSAAETLPSAGPLARVTSRRHRYLP